MQYRVLALACSAWLLCGTALADTGPPAGPQRAAYGENAERGRFAIVNGIRLYYEDHGAGQVVVPIHGNDQSIASVSKQLVALSRRYRVIAVDSRGHGKSGMGIEPLTYERRAEDCNALLDLLMTQPDIRPADLSGTSVPTLVMSGDADIIRLEHTVEIFRSLRSAQLAIFPGATHFVPIENADLFNATVLDFFGRDFRRPDSRNYLK